MQEAKKAVRRAKDPLLLRNNLQRRTIFLYWLLLLCITLLFGCSKQQRVIAVAHQAQKQRWRGIDLYSVLKGSLPHHHHHPEHIIMKGDTKTKLRRMTTVAAGEATTHATTINHRAAAAATTATRANGQIYSSLVSGILSGAISSVACAPLDLIRTRLQVWGEVVSTSQRQAVSEMVREIVRKEGIRGCFRGLSATLITVPTFWGVYFPLYDDFKWQWSLRYTETNPALIHMGSAVAAGIIADILCNPMFVVRTRLQTEAVHGLTKSTFLQTTQQLYREDGMRTFWKGMTANILGLTHVAVQFPVYELLKKRIRKNDEETALELLAASSLSKMTASLLTYPHEVVRSRMMDARQSVKFVATCRKIFQAEGFLGFYAGLPISLVRVLPNTAITFSIYELSLRFLRAKLLEENGNNDNNSNGDTD